MGMRKDEEIERTLRVYSKSSTFEYIPRSRKEDDYVVAKPMKLPECAVCGRKEPEPFECEFCHEYFCEDHLPAEKHECGAKLEEKGTPEEEAAIKRAIVAKLENIIGRLPAVYMLIDSAGFEELKAFLQALEVMEDTLTKVAEREEER
jgi:hypothetical protein